MGFRPRPCCGWCGMTSNRRDRVLSHIGQYGHGDRPPLKRVVPVEIPTTIVMPNERPPRGENAQPRAEVGRLVLVLGHGPRTAPRALRRPALRGGGSQWPGRSHPEGWAGEGGPGELGLPQEGARRGGRREPGQGPERAERVGETTRGPREGAREGHWSVPGVVGGMGKYKHFCRE